MESEIKKYENVIFMKKNENWDLQEKWVNLKAEMQITQNRVSSFTT